jgi:hypothetical protein
MISSMLLLAIRLLPTFLLLVKNLQQSVERSGSVAVYEFLEDLPMITDWLTRVTIILVCMFLMPF